MARAGDVWMGRIIGEITRKVRLCIGSMVGVRESGKC